MDYLACYGLYGVLIALGFIVVFVIWRQAILALIAAFVGRSAANRLIYLGSITVLGIGLFILLIAAEPYLRNGLKRRQLVRRFVRMAVPLLVAGALGLLLLAIA